jgi:DNA-directed RNA polymerase subunit RPC12/RpoP
MARKIPADIAAALSAARGRVPIRKLPDGKAMGLDAPGSTATHQHIAQDQTRRFWNTCHGCGQRHETPVSPSLSCPRCSGSKLTHHEVREVRVKPGVPTVRCRCMSCGAEFPFAVTDDVAEEVRMLRCPTCNKRKVRINGVGRLRGKGGRFLFWNAARLRQKYSRRKGGEANAAPVVSRKEPSGASLAPFKDHPPVG